MELIRNENDKYSEYENLLLERDQYRKEAGQIWTAYTQTFGQLITDVYQEKLECIKRKKTIAYYQAALNRGGAVDADAMQEYLEQEMAVYYAKLKNMISDNERCRDAKISSPYEVQRSKILYRRMAKLLHPDIHPETDQSEDLMELWERIQTAYAHNDVKSLSELEVLARKALAGSGGNAARAEVPDIEERIEAVKAEIDDILHSEPYTYGALLENGEAVAQKKAALSKELEEYRKYREELENVIDSILEGGGITLQWRMN